MHAAFSRFFSSTISFHELTAAVFARPSGDIRAQAAARRFRSSTISNHVLIAAVLARPSGLILAIAAAILFFSATISSHELSAARTGFIMIDLAAARSFSFDLYL